MRIPVRSAGVVVHNAFDIGLIFASHIDQLSLVNGAQDAPYMGAKLLDKLLVTWIRNNRIRWSLLGDLTNFFATEAAAEPDWMYAEYHNATVCMYNERMEATKYILNRLSVQKPRVR
jgi:hypothetical protein